MAMDVPSMAQSGFQTLKSIAMVRIMARPMYKSKQRRRMRTHWKAAEAMMGTMTLTVMNQMMA